MDHEFDTPIIVTGGETGCGEIIRGKILHIDYDEAAENESYARTYLNASISANAPQGVTESLIDILCDEHGANIEEFFKKVEDE